MREAVVEIVDLPKSLPRQDEFCERANVRGKPKRERTGIPGRTAAFLIELVVEVAYVLRPMLEGSQC